MTAVQVPLEEFVRWVDPPPLDASRLDQLEEHEVEQLLIARFRAFLRRDLPWREALSLAVTPDS
jgi:hypothetical protein